MFIETLNEEVRKEKGAIPNWVIAKKIGVHENTLNRWMREEMAGERKKTVLEAITEIKTEMESVAQ